MSRGLPRDISHIKTLCKPVIIPAEYGGDPSQFESRIEYRFGSPGLPEDDRKEDYPHFHNNDKSFAFQSV
jgi:hypothetical protein